MSYQTLDTAANRFAHALLDLPLGHDAKIAILSTNRLEYAIAYFGTARSGYSLAHISVRSTAANLAYMLEKIGADMLMFESQSTPVVESALAEIGGLDHLVLLDDSSEGRPPIAGTINFSKLIEAQPSTSPDVEIAESAPLGITFTGGTTGFPKAVLVSHKARCATAYAAAIEFGLNEQDIVGATTPMFHTAGLYVWFAPAIMLGATVVMLRTWDVGAFIDLVQRECVTATFLVPSQLNDLISHPDFSIEKLASLTKIGYAGAPMGRALLERVHSALPDVEFTENYGQSETCPITVLCPWHPEDKLGTVGRPAFNVQVKVVDSQGRSLPSGVVGEIITRGEQLFDGYYNDPEQTAEAFRQGDGWLWTGDVGYLDEDGFLTLVDRSKDMLVSGGENIYPAEIENALYRHEAVIECAVFGIPDERWGEVPAAHIVLAAGASVTEEELISFCTAQIPRHKRPRVVKFVDALPRTPVGKIQKMVLRAPYWAHRERSI